MTIEEQWRALESEKEAAGWRLQLARPLKGHPLFAAVEPGTGRRSLLLRVPESIVPPRRQWPACRGLELLALKLDGQAYFGVALKDARSADVFAALAEDLARRVVESETIVEAVRTLLGQLTRWQKFLTATSEGLSEEAQRGLWGELRFLHDPLLPIIGASKATGGWKGGERAHQDFQFEHGAVEVKTTLAKQPQSIRITSERQLDDTHWPVLFLHVLILEVHESGSSTLPNMVEAVRSALTGLIVERNRFEEVLLAAGYLDVHAARYTARSYEVRSVSTFQVHEGFPRIVEADLPVGVGDTSYVLNLAACQPFALDANAAIALINVSAESGMESDSKQA